VRCDFCEIPGDASASGKGTMSHPEMNSTSFIYERGAVERLRDHDRCFSCVVCKKNFTCRFNMDIHKRVHTGDETLHAKSVGKYLHSVTA
jgi:hypothetical protein